MKELIYLITRKFSVVFAAYIKIAFPLFLLIGIANFTFSARAFVQNLQNNATISLILSESTTTEQLSFINFKLSKNLSVGQYRYISPDAADTLLLQKTGEDFKNLLGFSPIPGSYSIWINHSVKDYRVIESLLKELKEYPAVVEVVFDAAYGKMLYSTFPKADWYLSALGLGVFILTILFQNRSIEQIFNAMTQIRQHRTEKGLKNSSGSVPFALTFYLVCFMAAVTSYTFTWVLSVFGFYTLPIEVASWQLLFFYTMAFSFLLGSAGVIFYLLPERTVK